MFTLISVYASFFWYTLVVYYNHDFIISFLILCSSIVLVATFSHGLHYIGNSSDHETLGMILFFQSGIHFSVLYLFELTLLCLQGKTKKSLRFLRASGPLTAVVLGTVFVKVFNPPSISMVRTA